MSIGREESEFLETLKATLESKDEAKQHFAKRKLEAYEKAQLLKSGVRVYKENKEEGLHPKKGKKITVRYVGYLADGKIFDSGDIEYKFGIGEVIQAWDQAFKSIRQGENATIFAPSSSAYGRRGAGKDIKGHTTLIFDVVIEKMRK